MNSRHFPVIAILSLVSILFSASLRAEDWTQPSPSSTSTTDDLSTQVEAGKIRLIGKVQATVAGGYILGAVYGSDGYVVKVDQSRPDYQLVSKLAPGGTVYVSTTDTGYKANDIVDIDVYPVGKYIDVFGDSMLAFTTDAAFARSYLKLKLHKG